MNKRRQNQMKTKKQSSSMLGRSSQPAPGATPEVVPTPAPTPTPTPANLLPRYSRWKDVKRLPLQSQSACLLSLCRTEGLACYCWLPGKARRLLNFSFFPLPYNTNTQQLKAWRNSIHCCRWGRIFLDTCNELLGAE